MMWFLLLLAGILGLLVMVDWLMNNDTFDKIPGPKGYFLVKNAFDFVIDPVQLFYYFRNQSLVYKQLYKLKLGPKKILLVHNPEDIELIISGTRNLQKGFLYRFIEPWLKKGLLISDGMKWQHRRKILTPAFHFNILRHFNTILEENCQTLVEQLKSEVGQPETNVTAYITDFTLSSICDTAMGTKLDASTDFGRQYKDGILALGQLIVYRAQRFWLYSDWLFPFTYVGRQQKALLQILSSFRDSVINKRRETNNNTPQYYVADNDEEQVFGKKRLAMLDLLLEAEKNGIIDAKGIGEEVDTFMFEGHDTTSTALQFAFMLLANDQNAQDKILEECDRIFGTSDRSPTMADLGQMKYLECCIKEAMRLYPPVAFFMRKTDQTLKLKNYEVPRGVECTLLIYDLHRREDQFEDPLEFKPERFAKEPTWHPYAYLPFSAGSRNCIGQKFAMMEMKLVLSAVIRNYRLLPITAPKDVIFVTDFILRPTKPIYVKLQLRESKALE